MTSPFQTGGGQDTPGTERDPLARAGVMPTSQSEQTEFLELRRLVQGVFDRYGYDFRNYEPAFLRDRMRELLLSEKLPTVSALLDHVLTDQKLLDRLLIAVSLDPVPLFDNPAVYAALRRQVLPELKNQFFIRVWQIGCATGERAFSLSIVLQEEGFAEKSRIYVTDLNAAALRKAKQGLLPLATVQARRVAYLESGGPHSLDRYYTASFDSAVLDAQLRKNMVFAHHNLATDGSLNEFHLIVCNSLMGRFNALLQRRVLELIHESLAKRGFLLLAPGESPSMGTHGRDYEAVDESVGLFRRVD